MLSQALKQELFDLHIEDNDESDREKGINLSTVNIK